MPDFISYFKNKKNLISLLFLGILALAIPLGVNLVRQQQILKSKATVSPIVFSGANVKTVGGKVVATKNDVTLAITAPDDTGAASSAGGGGSTGSGSGGSGSHITIGGTANTWQSQDMKFQSKVPRDVNQIIAGAGGASDLNTLLRYADQVVGHMGHWLTPQQANEFMNRRTDIRNWWQTDRGKNAQGISPLFEPADAIHAWLPGGLKLSSPDRDGLQLLVDIAHQEDGQGVSNPDQIIAMFPEVKENIISMSGGPEGSDGWPATCFLREWMKIGPNDPNAQLARRVMQQMPGQVGFDDAAIQKGCDRLHSRSTSLLNLMSLLPQGLIKEVYAQETCDPTDPNACGDLPMYCNGSETWQCTGGYCDSADNICHRSCQKVEGNPLNCGGGGGGGDNYCEKAGYHKCTVGAPAGSCTKDGKTCTAYETYQCNFGGDNYCDISNCGEPCAASSCPSGQQQVGDGTRDKIKSGDYLVDDTIVGPDLQPYKPGSGQCGYKYYKWQSTLDNGDYCISYSFGAWQDQSKCPKGSSPGPSSTPRGGTPPPSSPPSSTPAGSQVVAFKLADSLTGLDSVAKQAYTRPGPAVIPSFKFADGAPGTKTVFVQFYDQNDNKFGSPRQASIELLGPDPAITGCSLNFEGNNVVFEISGTNFGSDKGSVFSGSNQLQIRDWQPTNVKALMSNPPTGQSFPIKLTNTFEQSGESTCAAVSTLSVGAKYFCHAPQNTGQSNVELVIVEDTPGAKVIKQKVNIDRNGNIQGLAVNLVEGHKYKISLKAPRSVRRTIEVTASSGTTNVPNFVLPVGDIFPPDGGDGKINSLDKAELNRQWAIAVSTSGRSADFNGDGRVNSIDWACMRQDFNQEDQEEPTAPGPASSPSVSPTTVSSSAGIGSSLGP